MAIDKYKETARKFVTDTPPSYLDMSSSSPVAAKKNTSVSSPDTAQKQVAVPGSFNAGQDLTKVEEVKPVELRDLTAGNISDLASAESARDTNASSPVQPAARATETVSSPLSIKRH